MGGGGGGTTYQIQAGGSTSTVRVAEYIESNHSSLLNSISNLYSSVVGTNPYTNNAGELEIESAFFGTGFVIGSFPSLFDMYGKFMAGLDIETLYSQLFESTVNGSEISALVSAESALLSDDIETETLPRFEAGMRDINSVMASSFVIGKAVIEAARNKEVAKFSAELKYKMVPVALQRWQAHLQWNQGVIQMYAGIIDSFYDTQIAVKDFNYTVKAKNYLWPFTLLEFKRAALSAASPGTTTTNFTPDLRSSSDRRKERYGQMSSIAGNLMGGAAAVASLALLF